MRTLPYVSAILVIQIWLCGWQPAESHGQKPTEKELRAELKELMKERRDSAVFGLRDRLARWNAGGAETVTLRDVTLAMNEYFEAELDLAETHEQRLALHQLMVNQATFVYDQANGRHRSGTISACVVAQAKGQLSKARIALLRERLKGPLDLNPSELLKQHSFGLVDPGTEAIQKLRQGGGGAGTGGANVGGDLGLLQDRQRIRNQETHVSHAAVDRICGGVRAMSGIL